MQFYQSIKSFYFCVLLFFVIFLIFTISFVHFFLLHSFSKLQFKISNLLFLNEIKLNFTKRFFSLVYMVCFFSSLSPIILFIFSSFYSFTSSLFMYLFKLKLFPSFFLSFLFLIRFNVTSTPRKLF